MPTRRFRYATPALVVRVALVLVLTVVAGAFAVISLWFGLWTAILCVIGGLCALPARPPIAVIFFGYALAAPWAFAAVHPALLPINLAGIVLVSIGLWYALPGRWTCPDCGEVEIDLRRSPPVRCFGCGRETYGGRRSRVHLERHERLGTDHEAEASRLSA